MKFVAQMDEISSINIKTDTTFAILLEAQKQGHEIFYYLPSDLNFDFKAQELSAIVKKIILKNDPKKHYEIIETKTQDLSKFDVILVRQDPPFNMAYITSTYLLEKIKDKVLILNNPSEIRNCPEKIFIADFPDLIAPTLVTTNLQVIEEFRTKHQDIILKPIYSCGGDGVVLLKKDDANLASILEMLIKLYQTPVMVQKFLPEIKKGDKRIILVNGKAVGGISRIAKENEVRSNLHIGGTAAETNLSERDLEICEKIGPELKKRGLFLVGIDVIGDYLTEINVTSPTCVPEINQLSGGKIEEMIVGEIVKMVKGY